MRRVHLVVSGDVQGVGFRAWVMRLARRIQLAGWVKNREDKSVEILVEGSHESLEKFINYCQHGPEVSWVENVDVQWSAATGEFVGFEVLY